MIRRAVVALALLACGESALVVAGTPVVPDEPDVVDAGPRRDAGPKTPDAAPDAAPLACGTALPGPPLKDGLTEAEPGFAAALAAVDVDSMNGKPPNAPVLLVGWKLSPPHTS